MFRAIAEAERVHATRQLKLVEDLVVKDTDTNLEMSFQRRKTVSENIYPEFIKDANDEGEEGHFVFLTKKELDHDSNLISRC